MARHLQLTGLLLGVLASRSLCAQPLVPPIDLPHSYYYREMYLPQLTSGPSGVAWAPDSREVVFSMAGSLWRQKIDSTSAEQLRRSGLRLPAGLVTGRALHRLCIRSGGSDRAVAAESEFGSHAATDPWWCGQRRAALLSGWSTSRLCIDCLPPPLSPVCRRGARGTADQPGASHGGEQELAAALLLQRLRPRDQPDLDTRRPGGRVRFQSRSHSRHRRLVARAGGSRRGGG